MVETESRFRLPGLFRLPARQPVAAPAMTRCECHGISFEEAARRLGGERPADADELVRRTGCGGLCTACLPDLESYLESAASGPPRSS